MIRGLSSRVIALPIGLILAMVSVGYGAGGTTTTRTSQSVAVAIFSPASPASVPAGENLHIVASVAGTGNSAVTWTVSGAHAPAVANGDLILGTISGTSPSSTYNAPAEIPAGNNPVTITAISKTDPSKSASITVTITSEAKPNVISVAGNQADVTGIDINISTLNPTLGLADVGLCIGPICSAGVASITVAKGSTATVWLLGQGLTNATGTELTNGLSLSASQGTTGDVKVFNVTAQPPFDGLTNIKFQIQVGAEAASGARNLIVTNSDGELQAFVGALLIP